MSGGFLTLGDNYKVPLELFQWNRDKLRSRLSSESSTLSIVVLHGGPSPTRYDTDHEPIFRQESYFWWLTGVKEPDCSLILTPTEWILFIPHLPPDYATVMGRIKTCTDIQMEYGADQVLYTDDFETTLTTLLDQMPAATRICVMKGRNTDSGNDYDMGPPLPSSSSSSSSLPNNPRLAERVDEVSLFPIFAECRVTKSPFELRLMEHVTQVTSFAHAYVMRNTKPFMWEYQAESLFRHYTYYNYGSRLQSYTSICGCGPNAAILHYGHAGEPNSRQLQPTDQCLFDMGAEYQCYASDITCSFPANGIFSEKYKPIYQAVLDAQVTVYQMLRPGVSWVDCHKAAEASILQSLVNIGLITLGDNKTIEDLVELRLGAVFMPHGLGHLIGIDTHDVGGYLPGHPPRILEPGLAKLRTARIIEPNMVLTVEPGCYFIDHLLDGALESPILSPHLCADRLSEYRGYGGVRLEDVVWIPPNDDDNDGDCVNFTLCPRTIQEVEYVMAGGNWPPTIDDAPELRRVNLTKSNSPLGPPPSK
jgi:Xaa-Pro dipeptidase